MNPLIEDKLLEAIEHNDLATIENLINKGTDINATDEEGRTPLIHAILEDVPNLQTITWLLDHGANPNYPETVQNWTALHFAAGQQNEALVGLLLQHGAAINAVDCFGNTPLFRTVMNKNVNLNLVKLLLAHGANPSQRNHSDVSPISLAQETGETELLSLYRTI